VNISLVQLNAKGNEKQHDLQLRVQGDPVSGQLRWRAASTAKRNAGKDADNTRFQTPVGPVALTRAIALDYRNPSRKSASGHTAGPTRTPSCACRRPSMPARRARAVNLNRFDLAMLKPFMPDTTQASGVFSGNADVAGTPPKRGCRRAA
jgi:translocation and assembly module TamB